MNKIFCSILLSLALQSCANEDKGSFGCSAANDNYMYTGSDGTKYYINAPFGGDQAKIVIEFPRHSKDNMEIISPMKSNHLGFSLGDSILVNRYLIDGLEWRDENLECNNSGSRKNDLEEILIFKCKNSKEYLNSEFEYSNVRGITSIYFSFLKGVEGGRLTLASGRGLAAPCPELR